MNVRYLLSLVALLLAASVSYAQPGFPVREGQSCGPGLSGTYPNCSLDQAPTAFSTSDTTPDVSGDFLAYKTADTSIFSDFDDGTDHTGIPDGRWFIIYFLHAGGLDCTSSEITCNGGQDWTGAVGDVVSVRYSQSQDQWFADAADAGAAASADSLATGTVAERDAYYGGLTGGEIWWVTDGTSAGDCTTGGGGPAFVVLCVYDAATTAWIAIANTVLDGSITNAKLANMAEDTLKGRIDTGSGVPTDLVVSDVLTMLDLCTTCDADFSTVTTAAADDPCLDFGAATAGETLWSMCVNHDSGADDDDAVEIKAGGTPMVTISSVGDLTATGFITATGSLTGLIAVSSVTADTGTLTAASMIGRWYINTDTGDAFDRTLPSVAAGMSACFLTKGAEVITLDPQNDDVIQLDATALTAGNAIDSSGTAGDFICLLGIDSTNWVTLGRRGTWSDGGAD